MDVEAIKAELLGGDLELFVSKYVFDKTPELFSKDRAAYAQWRRRLAKLLDVDPACLVIVGSASAGFSLSPYKGMKTFSATSDVDVAIVSPYHFQIAWRFLRSNGHLRPSMSAKERNSFDDHRTRLIYWGTVATDILLGYLPFGAQWLAAASAMSASDPVNGREINFRLYGDSEALTAYSNESVSSLRKTLIKGT